VNQQNAIRVDGVYQSEKINDSYHYLRFYDDGLVIAANVFGSPEEIATWFNRKWAEENDVSKGIFVISGYSIEFSATSSRGTVDYEGEIEGQRLVIRVHSHINNYRNASVFEFIQLEAWAAADA
jgi:hypothetical protein